MSRPNHCFSLPICSLLWAVTLLSFPVTASAITIDEAVSLAKENLSSYKASLLKVRSSEALYDASLSPYLPSLDLTAFARHYYSAIDYDLRNYQVTLSYTLFDGGKRSANREIARLTLDSTRADLQKTFLELEFSVKAAFYTAIAQKEILEQAKIQLEDAKKDYEVADGRYRFGIAKLSDVLQASVRLEQAKFNLVQAEGDFRKTLSELNSLTGRPFESGYDIQGSLDIEAGMPDRKLLFDLSLKRPEVRQAENSIGISENNKSLTLSAFYPAISVDTSYSRTSGGYFQIFFPEEKAVGITAIWNIFELGKFYKQKSSEIEKGVSAEQLNELKRQITLDVNKAFEDFVTAFSKISVAQQQLKQAEHNYSQAFGEYKVGKADILSLVQAESSLSNARELLITSKLNLILSKSLLERVAGIDKLESVGK